MADIPVWGAVALEGVKLVAQLGGALAVARLAVTWALKRYQTEKVWERRLSAYTDTLAGLAAMRKVIDREIDHYEGESKGEWDKAKYTKASATVEEVIAIARLILPDDVADRLYQYELEFADAVNSFAGEPTDVLYPQSKAIEGLIEFLVARGRKDLGGFDLVIGAH